MRLLIALFALLLAQPASAAATAVTDLAKPPADATQYTIMSSAGRHGQSARWVAADGTRMGRESMDLRGQGRFRSDSASRLGADGMLSSTTIRGFSPQGDVAETLNIAGGIASWKSPVDAGSAPYAKPAM